VSEPLYLPGFTGRGKALPSSTSMQRLARMFRLSYVFLAYRRVGLGLRRLRSAPDRGSEGVGASRRRRDALHSLTNLSAYFDCT
jgi:hypothetical protein